MTTVSGNPDTPRKRARVRLDRWFTQKSVSMASKCISMNGFGEDICNVDLVIDIIDVNNLRCYTFTKFMIGKRIVTSRQSAGTSGTRRDYRFVVANMNRGANDRNPHEELSIINLGVIICRHRSVEML